MKTLADILRELRASRGLSLRELHRKTGISNAYLSQMEKGKVQEPSHIFLHKLAEFYGVDYAYLMRSIGYPMPGEKKKGMAGKIARSLESLTEFEKQEVYRFIEQFILPRRKR